MNIHSFIRIPARWLGNSSHLSQRRRAAQRQASLRQEPAGPSAQENLAPKATLHYLTENPDIYRRYRCVLWPA